MVRPMGRCGLCFFDVEPGEVYIPLPPAQGRPREGGHLRCANELAALPDEDVRPNARWLVERARTALAAL